MRMSAMLRTLRKSRGLTQEALGKAMGVSAGTVARWEKGETYPDTTLIPFLASFFRVSAYYLLGMTDGPTDAILLRTREQYRVLNRAAADRLVFDMKRARFPKLLSSAVTENETGVYLEVEREYGEWQEK